MGFHALVWVDVATHVLSAAAILTTTRRPAGPRTGGARGLLGELGAGPAFLRGEVTASALVVVNGVFLRANASPTALLAGTGEEPRARGSCCPRSASGSCSAPLVRALVDRVSPGYLLGGTLAATAVGFGLLFGSTPMATALPAAVVTGAFGSTALVVVKTSVRRITPNELLGRVGSALFTAEAVAAFAGPVIAEASSPATATLVACGGTVLSGVLAVVPLPRSVHTGHRETDARSVTWSSDGRRSPAWATGQRSNPSGPSTR